MQSSLERLIPWFAVFAVLVAAAAVVLLRARRRPPVAAPSVATEAAASAARPDERAAMRSFALDALGEAVLIADIDGRVRDCNSSALALFDRHRSAIEEQYANALRRFEGLDERDPYRVASERAIWVGEAWARQPDGGMRLCMARVIAVRDGRARVTGFVESFRDVTADRQMGDDFRSLLYGVRAFDSETATPNHNLRAVREELRVLAESFRDLDQVIRQYERLLPSLGADDPLTESIAGAAHDARSTVAAVGVPMLLEEIPRSLSRLRGHLQQLTRELGASEEEAAAASGAGRADTGK